MNELREKIAKMICKNETDVDYETPYKRAYELSDQILALIKFNQKEEKVKPHKRTENEECSKCRWQGMYCIAGDCYYEPKEPPSQPKEIEEKNYIVCEWHLGGGVDFHNMIFVKLDEAIEFARKFIGKNCGISVCEIKINKIPANE